MKLDKYFVVEISVSTFTFLRFEQVKLCSVYVKCHVYPFELYCADVVCFAALNFFGFVGVVLSLHHEHNALYAFW